jgi:hypothetical protein
MGRRADPARQGPVLPHPWRAAGGSFRGVVRAGLPDPLVVEVRTWADFHKAFGADLNNRIYRDALQSPRGPS